jgi:hypothetical protein
MSDFGSEIPGSIPRGETASQSEHPNDHPGAYIQNPKHREEN